MNALRRFLVDFDAPAPDVQLPVTMSFDDDPSVGEFEADLAEPPPDLVAEAVAAALSAAESAHAAALADLAAGHAAELAEARALWAAEEGGALAEGFRAAVARMGEALGDAAAAALEPMLGDAARALAIDGLRVAIGDLVLAGTGGAIAVAGPADLLEGLQAALAEAGTAMDRMTFAEAESADVVVTADNSRIETRLAAWARALGRRLDPAADVEAGPASEEAP